MSSQSCLYSKTYSERCGRTPYPNPTNSAFVSKVSKASRHFEGTLIMICAPALQQQWNPLNKKSESHCLYEHTTSNNCMHTISANYQSH